MKALLSFTLPDDTLDFNMAHFAPKAFYALTEIREHIRRKVKYDETLTEPVRKAYEDVREQLNELLSDIPEELL